MKNIVLKYASALLAVWYCLSITGFEVHSCEATGDTFVTSVLAGTTCEDIHPEHDCCDHHEEDDDCCTNEIEVLDSVVLTNADEDDHIQLSAMFSCLFIENNYDVLLFPESVELSYEPDSGQVIQPDCQAILNIWRI